MSINNLLYKINDSNDIGVGTNFIDVSGSGSFTELKANSGISTFTTLNITNVNSGNWEGNPIQPSFGGTGLNSLGTVGQVLKVNSIGNAYEWGDGGSNTTDATIATMIGTNIPVQSEIIKWFRIWRMKYTSSNSTLQIIPYNTIPSSSTYQINQSIGIGTNDSIGLTSTENLPQVESTIGIGTNSENIYQGDSILLSNIEGTVSSNISQDLNFSDTVITNEKWWRIWRMKNDTINEELTIIPYEDVASNNINVYQNINRTGGIATSIDFSNANKSIYVADSTDSISLQPPNSGYSNEISTGLSLTTSGDINFYTNSGTAYKYYRIWRIYEDTDKNKIEIILFKNNTGPDVVNDDHTDVNNAETLNGAGAYTSTDKIINEGYSVSIVTTDIKITTISNGNKFTCNVNHNLNTDDKIKIIYFESGTTFTYDGTHITNEKVFQIEKVSDNEFKIAYIIEDSGNNIDTTGTTFAISNLNNIRFAKIESQSDLAGNSSKSDDNNLNSNYNNTNFNGILNDNISIVERSTKLGKRSYILQTNETLTDLNIKNNLDKYSDEYYYHPDSDYTLNGEDYHLRNSIWLKVRQSSSSIQNFNSFKLNYSDNNITSLLGIGTTDSLNSGWLKEKINQAGWIKSFKSTTTITTHSYKGLQLNITNNTGIASLLTNNFETDSDNTTWKKEKSAIGIWLKTTKDEPRNLTIGNNSQPLDINMSNLILNNTSPENNQIIQRIGNTVKWTTPSVTDIDNIKIGKTSYASGSFTNVGINSNNVPTGNGLLIGGKTTVRGHIIPTENAQFDLGSAEYKIRHAFLSNNSLWTGDKFKISIDSGKLKFRKRKEFTEVPVRLQNKIKDKDLERTGVIKSIDLFKTPVLNLNETLKSGRTISEPTKLTLSDWQNYAKIKTGEDLDINELFGDDDWEDTLETNTGNANFTTLTSDTLEITNNIKTTGIGSFNNIKTTTTSTLIPGAIIDSIQLKNDGEINNISDLGTLEKFSQVELDKIDGIASDADIITTNLLKNFNTFIAGNDDSNPDQTINQPLTFKKLIDFADDIKGGLGDILVLGAGGTLKFDTVITPNPVSSANFGTNSSQDIFIGNSTKNLNINSEIIFEKDVNIGGDIAISDNFNIHSTINTTKNIIFNNKNDKEGSIQFYPTATSNYDNIVWDARLNNVGQVPKSLLRHYYRLNASTGSRVGWNIKKANNMNELIDNTDIIDNATNSCWINLDSTNKSISVSFTGQHRNVSSNLDIVNHIDNYKGMIVYSTGGYNTYNYSKKTSEKDKRGITYDDALPIVEITSSRQNKKVFGVISNNEENERVLKVGAFNTKYSNENDDKRIYINSIGEGAIWIVNTNGNLENGDYIQSSDIYGLGEKQDSTKLHNYTVAKITCDCDFSLDNIKYKCIQFTNDDGVIYRKAFVGCTYHCG